MSAAALLAMVLLAGPSKPIDVRVKSRHEKATSQGGGAECYKVGAQEALRSAAIGPGSVRVSLRRLAAEGASPIEIKLTRDGREVARLALPAKAVQKFTGESELASAPTERIIDLPKGPHTLFVEVGPGDGHVLVSFDEPVTGIAAALARKPGAAPPADVAAGAPSAAASPARTGPPAAAPKPGAKAPLAKAPAFPAADKKPAAGPPPKEQGAPKSPAPKYAAAPPGPADKPQPKPAELAHAAQTAPVAPEKPAGPLAAKADKKPAAGPPPKEQAPESPAPKHAAAPPGPADKPQPKPAELAHAAQTAPVAPEKPAEPLAATVEPGAPPAAANRPAEAGVRAAAAPLSARRLFVGARAGAASQAQLAAIGPAAGLSARYLGWGEAGPAGVRGLLVGLSADILRYSLALEVGDTRAMAAYTQQIDLTNVPVLAEALWSFGDPGRRRLTPVLGVTGGLSLCSISSKGASSPIHESQARPAFGAVAGVEFPLEAGRVGVEVRYLYSTTASKGPVQNFQVGGILVQASWRFGF